MWCSRGPHELSQDARPQRTWHRYYYCRNHDPLRAGGESRRCPERNIRADALDAFVFDQIRTAMTHPDQPPAGEQAVTLRAPIPDDELLATELAPLDRKIDAAETERRRLIDLYQSVFIELPELQRRSSEVSSRRKELQHKRTSLADERTALARDNELRRRVTLRRTHPHRHRHPRRHPKAAAAAPTHRRRSRHPLARPDPAPYRPRPATTAPDRPNNPNRQTTTKRQVTKTFAFPLYVTNRATEFTVARCVGIESEMELAFAGLHDLCTPMLSHLDALVEPQRQALSVALGHASGERPEPFLVALAALSLLAEASAERPVLCAVDDVQWLDHATAQVLGFVGRRLLAEPVALVFATRKSTHSPDPLAGLPELRLAGLDEQSARALLASASPAPVDESVRTRILEETRGNPLALLELGTGLGAVDFAGGFALPDTASVPHRIQAEYLTRLHRLPQQSQRLVLVAAADPVGDWALLQRAARTLQLDVDAAERAVDAGLLDIGARLRFRHPLLRSAVYRAADVEERRMAHAALAQATDPRLDPDRRAWHRAYAAGTPDEDVAAELIGSADRAQGRGGVAAAAAFWERAVVLTPDPGRRAERALTAAEAKYAAGDYVASQKLLAAAEIGRSTNSAMRGSTTCAGKSRSGLTAGATPHRCCCARRSDCCGWMPTSRRRHSWTLWSPASMRGTSPPGQT